MNRFNWDHIFSPTLLSHFAYGYVNRNEGYGSVPAQSPTAIANSRTRSPIMLRPAANFCGNGVSTFAGWGNNQGSRLLEQDDAALTHRQ